MLAFAGKRNKTRPGVLATSPWPERKIDQVMPLMRKAQATGRSHVVAIGVAQEYQRLFTPCAKSRSPRPSPSPLPGIARAFFEALAADNLDLGGPDNMEIIFNRQVRSTTRRRLPHRRRPRQRLCRPERLLPAFTHQDLPQRRAGAALETVINDTYDIGVLRRIAHLDELIAKSRDVNARLLDTVRAGQGCVLASPAAIEPVAAPTLTEAGRRARRFGSATPGSWP